jgi:hypothetical protein
MSDNTFEPLIESLLAARAGLLAKLGSLSDSEIEALVTRLKGQADSSWYKDIERSLALADLIMLVGALRRNFGHLALGLMARGNALAVKAERLQEAQDVLGQAGMLYRLLGDDVGWARTRIMRLAICVDLDRYAEGLRESTEADSIFLGRAKPSSACGC